MSTNSNVYAMVPPEIRPLVSARHILSSEDPNLYDALFGNIASLMKPRNALQWLDIKKLTDLYWEQMRLSRIKPGIIQSAQKKAMASLFQSTTYETVLDHTRSGNVTMGEANALEWFRDPTAREELQEVLSQFEYSRDTVDAMAFVHHLDAQMAIEKMQMSFEMRQAAIRARLEEERNVLQLHAGSDDDTHSVPVQPQLVHHNAEQHEEGEADPESEEQDEVH